MKQIKTLCISSPRILKTIHVWQAKHLSYPAEDGRCDSLSKAESVGVVVPWEAVLCSVTNEAIHLVKLFLACVFPLEPGVSVMIMSIASDLLQCISSSSCNALKCALGVSTLNVARLSVLPCSLGF